MMTDEQIADRKRKARAAQPLEINRAGQIVSRPRSQFTHYHEGGIVGNFVGGEHHQSAEFDNELTMEQPKRVSREPVDPLVTQDRVLRDILQWVKDSPSPEVAKQRAKFIRGTNPQQFAHLSDDQIVEQIGEVAKAMARESAEEVYAQRGWDRGTVIRGNP